MFNIMDPQTSNYPQLFIIRWMSSNIWEAVFFVRWKANFLSCQGANRNQTYTVTLHQAAGLSARGSKRGMGRERRESDTDEVRECYTGQLKLSVFFPPLPHNDVGKDSLCIGLINSYSSSARHPGNRSGFALGLIFRPVEDSQSIRALFRLQTANFLDLPKKWGEARENERVTEEGVDDIEREMERR